MTTEFRQEKNDFIKWAITYTQNLDLVKAMRRNDFVMKLFGRPTALPPESVELDNQITNLGFSRNDHHHQLKQSSF